MSSNNQDRNDRTDIQLHKERCFLVGAQIPGRYDPAEEPLTELASLVDTAGGEVVGSITQKLDRPTTRYYLGKGKYYDMVDMARESGADTIIVDDDLTPAQLGTIEAGARLKVIDRSEVILDIFTHRARSFQARLQVEMAQLQYELPRLSRKWTHLERLGGGIGTRGPGETQIETDRRIIRGKIARLRKQLDEIEQRKVREVSSREKVFTMCLVGYTNAGKSTLLNRLTEGGAFVENRLFATLDTLTRKITLPEGNEALISDTVGFIRRLPHHLVASFHATLEEASQADLLLQVIDASDPMALTEARSVNETLYKLGMQDKERLYVFNKCDVAKDATVLTNLREYFSPAVEVSAITGEGIDSLLEILQEKSSAGQRKVKLRFPAADGRRLAIVNSIGMVESTDYDESDVLITVTLTPADLARIQKLNGPMEVL